MIKRRQGFCILLENGKYTMVPNTGEFKDVIAFAETTEDVETLLGILVVNNILNELYKISDFPVVSTAVAQALSGVGLDGIVSRLQYLQGGNNEFR